MNPTTGMLGPNYPSDYLESHLHPQKQVILRLYNRLTKTMPFLQQRASAYCVATDPPRQLWLGRQMKTSVHSGNKCESY